MRLVNADDLRWIDHAFVDGKELFYCYKTSFNVLSLSFLRDLLFSNQYHKIQFVIDCYLFHIVLRLPQFHSMI